MSDAILTSLENGLLTITMNRPERRNAMSPDFTLGLLNAAHRAAEDSEVRAVLLKGAGGTFCVGGDVRGMADPSRKPPTLEERPSQSAQTQDTSTPTPPAPTASAGAAGAEGRPQRSLPLRFGQEVQALPR